VWLGAHIGIADGLAEAPVTGRAIGCDAIQIFSKSPQMWQGPAIPQAAADGFAESVRREGLRATAVHHGYLANLASPKPPMLAQSRAAFADELARAELLRVDALIFHPGAHLGSGVDAGLKTLIESLDEATAKLPGGTVRILLENAAGQGTAIGSAFPELRRVLDGVREPGRFGVAVDTCHLFAAGIDLRSESAYGAFMDRLDAELGRAAVRAFHLNDAKGELGSHRDRHENIGKGQIGPDGFRHLVTDRAWAEVPGYLETPLDDDDYARYREDLATLRGLAGGETGKPARVRTPRAARAAPRRRATPGGVG